LVLDVTFASQEGLSSELDANGRGPSAALAGLCGHMLSATGRIPGALCAKFRKLSLVCDSVFEERAPVSADEDDHR
jgi:hypothetical protein